MDQNQTNTQQIQQQIAAALGIASLSDDKQKEIIEKATETLLKKLFLMTVEKLSDEDKKTYMELVEKEDDPKNIEKFLVEKIPDYEKMIEAATQEFITGMKAAAENPTA